MVNKTVPFLLELGIVTEILLSTPSVYNMTRIIPEILQDFLRALGGKHNLLPGSGRLRREENSMGLGR